MAAINPGLPNQAMTTAAADNRSPPTLANTIPAAAIPSWQERVRGIWPLGRGPYPPDADEAGNRLMMLMKLSDTGVNSLMGHQAAEFKRLSRVSGPDWAVMTYNRAGHPVWEYYVWVCWTSTDDQAAAHNELWSRIYTYPSWFSRWYEHFILNGLPFGVIEGYQ